MNPIESLSNCQSFSAWARQMKIQALQGSVVLTFPPRVCGACTCSHNPCVAMTIDKICQAFCHAFSCLDPWLVNKCLWIIWLQWLSNLSATHAKRSLILVHHLERDEQGYVEGKVSSPEWRHESCHGPSKNLARQTVPNALGARMSQKDSEIQVKSRNDGFGSRRTSRVTLNFLKHLKLRMYRCMRLHFLNTFESSTLPKLLQLPLNWLLLKSVHKPAHIRMKKQSKTWEESKTWGSPHWSNGASWIQSHPILAMIGRSGTKRN